MSIFQKPGGIIALLDEAWYGEISLFFIVYHLYLK